MEALDVTQSKASRHLATLRHAGLVVDRREAAWSYYSICPVESELEKAQLRVLRTKLAEYPDAAQVLNDLQAWMVRKDRDATCAEGRVYPTATKNKTKIRERARRQGGSR
jgi:ArsR family transcriptional regulator